MPNASALENKECSCSKSSNSLAHSLKKGFSLKGYIKIVQRLVSKVLKSETFEHNLQIFKSLPFVSNNSGFH